MRNFVLLMFAFVALASCSSEQSLQDPVKMSDLVNTGCKNSFSAKESRPEFYASEMEKSSMLRVSVDGKGCAAFLVSNIKGNCALKEFRPKVDAQEDNLTIVLVPYSPDSTVEADCICNYDVSFKLSSLALEKYHLKVYYSDCYGKYDATKPAYDGVVSFIPNETFEIELQ